MPLYHLIYNFFCWQKTGFLGLRSPILAPFGPVIAFLFHFEPLRIHFKPFLVPKNNMSPIWRSFPGHFRIGGGGGGAPPRDQLLEFYLTGSPITTFRLAENFGWKQDVYSNIWFIIMKISVYFFGYRGSYYNLMDIADSFDHLRHK